MPIPTTITKQEDAFKPADFIAPLLMFVLFWVLFFKKLPFTWSICLLVCTLSMAFYSSKKLSQKLNNLDFSIIGVFIYESISYFSGWPSISQGLPYILELIVIFLFYLTARIILINRKRWFWFILLLVFSIFIITTIAYIFFLFLNLHMAELFANDISNFKGLFFPFNYFINDWSAFLLCFLCFIFIAIDFLKNKNLILWLFLPIIVGIFLTFSRGAYLSLLLALPFTAFLLNYNRGNRVSIINIVVFFLMVALILFPFISSIITTFKLNATLSQARSTLGRYQLLNVASKIFSENWALGIGNGNFSLYASQYFENDNIQFTSRVTNSLLQALCEKGVLGTLAWTLPVYSILYCFRRRKTITYSLVAVVVSFAIVFVKEMTFSTFFESIEMKLMIITLCAYQSFYLEGSNIKATRLVNMVIIAIILVSVSTATIISHNKHKADAENNLVFTTHAPREMLIHANKATVLFPFEPAFTINTSLIYWKLSMETSDRSWLDSAEVYAKKSVTVSPFDFQLQSNLYWIYYSQGKTQMAISKMKQLADRFPYTSLYSLGVAEMYNRTGRSDNSVQYYSQASKRSPAILENLRSSGSPLYAKVAEQVIQSLSKYREANSMLITDPIQQSKDAELLLILKDTSLAEVILRRINSSFPNLSRPYLNLGLIDLQKGNKEQYMVNLRKAKLLDAKDYLTDFYLSSYLNRFDDFKKSKSLLNSSIGIYNSLPSLHYVKATNWYTSKIFKNDIIPETLLYKTVFPIPSIKTQMINYQ